MNSRPVLFLNRYPTDADRRDGFYQRVNAIDQLLSDAPRVYLRTDGPATQLTPSWTDVAPDVRELRISRRNPLHRRAALQVAREAVVYAHSVRSLEGFNGDVYHAAHRRLLDLHGAVPEEADMLGEADKSPLFTDLEQAGLTAANVAIGVSQALLEHAQTKVPTFRGDPVLLPILPIPTAPESPTPRDSNGILYVGGFQAWQNWEAMLQFAADNPGKNVTFLTPDPARARALLENRNLTATVDSVPPDQLPGWLPRFRFGFLIRSDSVVNRVACPTKLAEYLHFGVVPIVDSLQIGDFADLGLQAANYRSPLPSPEAAEAMAQRNLEVLEKLRDQETRCRTYLRELVTRFRKL